MDHVQVPDVSVKVFVSGSEIARVDFYQVALSPHDWEAAAAINDIDSKSAVRACLLAAVAELSADGWQTHDFEAESGDHADDQLELPI